MIGIDIEADIAATLASLAEARFNLGNVATPLAHSLSVVLDAVKDNTGDPVKLSGGVFPSLKRLNVLRNTIKAIEDDKDLWALIRECARSTPEYQNAVLVVDADGHGVSHGEGDVNEVSDEAA